MKKKRPQPKSIKPLLRTSTKTVVEEPSRNFQQNPSSICLGQCGPAEQSPGSVQQRGSPLGGAETCQRRTWAASLVFTLGTLQLAQRRQAHVPNMAILLWLHFCTYPIASQGSFCSLNTPEMINDFNNGTGEVHHQ